LNYLNQIKKHEFYIERIGQYTSEKAIESVRLFITKGNRLVLLNVDTGIIILNDELQLHKFNTNYLTSTKDLVYNIFQNYFAYIDNNAQKIKIVGLEKPDDSFECDLSSYTQNGYVASLIYDSYNQLIYALLNDYKFLMVSFSNAKVINECSILKSQDFKDYINDVKVSPPVRNISLQVVRKDILIKSDNKIIFIDSNEIDKSINFKVINMSKNSATGQLVHVRTQPNNYLLLYSDNMLLYLYEVVNPSIKLLAAGEDTGYFNFKFPVILISLVIIFLYHYFKNKKSGTVEGGERLNEDLIKKLAELGKMDVKLTFNTFRAVMMRITRRIFPMKVITKQRRKVDRELNNQPLFIFL
jgi:hypothetical protein